MSTYGPAQCRAFFFFVTVLAHYTHHGTTLLASGRSRKLFLRGSWDRRVYRALEIVPGFLIWTTLIGVFVLSFFKPVWVAFLILTIAKLAIYCPLSFRYNERVMVQDGNYYLFVGRAAELSSPRERKLYRAFEMLPGVLTWSTFCAVVALSFVRPVWVAVFIIVFDVFWLTNAGYLAIFVVASYARMRRALKTDWLAKLEALKIQSNELGVSSWREVVHLVILPMFRESETVVGGALEALARAHYPREQLFVVLATEERAGEEAQRTARELAGKFRNRFGKFLVTAHPSSIPGEVAGKGANETWAAKEAVRLLIDAGRIPYERVVVSSFDSDTQVGPQYFACLAYHVLTVPKPFRASYQPIPLYNNNIWDAPFFSRVAAIGSTIWQLFMQSQPDTIETFSSHSMSLRALADVGYWNTRVVSEDSVIFSQCFLAFDGDYRVVSLFYPVSMDANVSHSLRATAVSVYKQHRRWAYMEKIPYLFFGFLKNRRIKLWKKFRMVSRLLFGYWMWATASFLIAFLGWLPVMLGGEAFRETVLSFNLPRLTARMLTAAMAGLILNGALTFLLLPPLPRRRSRFVYLGIFLQWLILPFTMPFFSSLPAIEAQTRLMLGKYLGFYVTEKVRKNTAHVRE